MFNSKIKQPQFREMKATLSRPLLPTASTPGSSDSPTDSPQMNADTVVKFHNYTSHF